MNFIDKEQRAMPRCAAPLGSVEYLSQIGYAGKHGRKRLEMKVCNPCQQTGYRRLACSRRTPQYHRCHSVIGDHSTYGTVRSQNMLLTQNVMQERRAQPVRQRAGSLIFKKAACLHHHFSPEPQSAAPAPPDEFRPARLNSSGERIPAGLPRTR